jgi:hypothetical protein
MMNLLCLSEIVYAPIKQKVPLLLLCHLHLRYRGLCHSKGSCPHLSRFDSVSIQGRPLVLYTLVFHFREILFHKTFCQIFGDFIDVFQYFV